RGWSVSFGRVGDKIIIMIIIQLQQYCHLSFKECNSFHSLFITLVRKAFLKQKMAGVHYIPTEVSCIPFWKLAYRLRLLNSSVLTQVALLFTENDSSGNDEVEAR